MVALSSCQLGSDAYVGKLWRKLSEANSNQSALAKRLTEAKHKLKGNKATLEEVGDQLEGEKAGAAML